MQTAPETIGGYKVIRELGRGAMGTVYLAFQESLGRDLAIKLMAPEFTRDTEFVERFRREGRIAARLRHPNIVQVYDFCDRDGLYYIAMEYLGSRTLKSLVRDKGRVPVAESARLTDQLLAALEHAHSQGITHRDIKPANVMVTDAGDAALTDFSIAHMKSASKLTQTGSVLGTPEYMAPEQFEGKSDLRSDLYATGVILYEMLTGFSPFHADTIAEVMKKQLFVAPDPPAVVDFTIPEAISQVVVKALAKDPAERYQTATEMRHALREALRITAGTTPSQIGPPPTPAPAVTAPPPPVAVVAPRTADPATGKSCPACGKIVQNQRFCPGCGQDTTRPAKKVAAEPQATPTPAPTASPVSPVETREPEKSVAARGELPPRLDLRPSDSLSGRNPLPEKVPAVAPSPSPTPAPPPVARVKPVQSLAPDPVPVMPQEPPRRSGGLLGFVDDQGTNILALSGAGCILLIAPAKFLGYGAVTGHLLMGGVLGSLCLMAFSIVLAFFLGVRGAGGARILAPLLISIGLVIGVIVMTIPVLTDPSARAFLNQ